MLAAKDKEGFSIFTIDHNNAGHSFWIPGEGAPAVNLSNVDINLLKVLDAVIAERNVTRAGKRLVGRSRRSAMR